ncbi:MAG: thioredoxin family protein [Chitinophagales bacterium]
MKKYFLFLLVLFFINACDKEKEDLVDTSKNELTDINGLANFESEIDNGVSVVFFHASWCTVCAEQRPAVETSAANISNANVLFAEVEFEDNADINLEYGIEGFPTIVFFKDGVEEERFVGKGHSVQEIQDIIDSLL